MQQLIEVIDNQSKKKKVVQVKSGDTVRVHQKIKEGSKERVQVFEGLVINVRRKNSVNNTFTVRRVASGVGVEKTFMMHSPLIQKVEIVKRSDVRRNNLSYMRKRAGKGARLSSIEFDRDKVNEANEVEEEVEFKSKDETSKEDTTDKDKVEEKTESKSDPKEVPEAKETKEKPAKDAKAEEKPAKAENSESKEEKSDDK